MSEAVKPGRPYQGAARQARTRRTRAAIAAAARSLFAERGYAATTIEAISDRSDTPQATVYRLFSSKLGILKALLDDSVAGDDEAVAMLDRPQVRALLSAADPKDQLAGFAALVRDVMTRVGPVHRILADAARSDQDAASLLAEIARQRHEGQRRIASSLARSGALRPGLAERDAADIIHALASPEVHGLLVSDRGWTSERHEKWLRQILIDQLLPRELPDDHADQTARHKKPGTSGLTNRRDWLAGTPGLTGLLIDKKPFYVKTNFAMRDVVYLDQIEQAEALLKPQRIETLRQLAEPRSCTEVAVELDQTPQRVYYHVKRLQEAGLVRQVAERRVRGINEGIYQAAGRSYWLSPGLVGRIGLRQTRDRLSLGYLVDLMEGVQADVAALDLTRPDLPSIGVSGDIRVRPEQRKAFLDELQQTLQDLFTRYGGADGDAFRLAVACYPKGDPDDRA